jgi:hypothetical protein
VKLYPGTNLGGLNRPSWRSEPTWAKVTIWRFASNSPSYARSTATRTAIRQPALVIPPCSMLGSALQQDAANLSLNQGSRPVLCTILHEGFRECILSEGG